MTHRILLASSDTERTSLVQRGLEGSGVSLSVVTSAAEVPRAVDREGADALVIDLASPFEQGTELLGRVIDARPDLPVVVLADADQAAACLRAGAVDYVPPADGGLRLRTALRNALTRRKLMHQLRSDPKDTPTAPSLAPLSGHSRGIVKAKALLERAAQKDVAVLLVGEAGAGKERAARALHADSRRAGRPFIAVRCGSLSTDRLGLELFGSSDGQVGALEEAAGGTVYLDQVEQLGADHQARLLEVLQESYVRRLGDPRSMPVDVRIVAASTHEPGEWTAKGVREDLQHRLAVFPIHVPALRTRPEDLELLALVRVEHFAQQHGRELRGIEAEALDALTAHDWPGNLPELESAIERAVMVADGGSIRADMLPKHVRSASLSAKDAGARGLFSKSDPLAALETADDVRPFEEQEKRILVHALKCTQWNVLETARRLRIGRATVYRKIERFGLTRGASRGVI